MVSIDECIKIREDYAGRSLRHHRFLKQNPGTQFDSEDTDSLKAFLRTVFRELQDDIKILFDPDDEYSIIMPTLNTLRECIRALNEEIPEDSFKEPELIGWVYQYFQTEEKNRVLKRFAQKRKRSKAMILSLPHPFTPSATWWTTLSRTHLGPSGWRCTPIQNSAKNGPILSRTKI